jgi:dTDP-4-dehydrorhamnose reductase
MMRALVLGAGGMAGHVVALHLRDEGHSVDTLSARRRLDETTHLVDAMQIDQLVSVLKQARYDTVVNCIGLLVRESESHKDRASFLNAYLPHFLEDYYSATATRVLHLSTDCVFSGAHPPYDEQSAFDGDLFYDRSKALGEVVNSKDLTLRMSIVGPDLQPDGIGLFNWFMQQRGTVSGYTGSVWNGITTVELARGIVSALRVGVTGLYHLVPRYSVSKFELLLLFNRIFDRGLLIEPVEGPRADKTLVNTRSDWNFEVGDYESMIETMKSWIDERRNIYSHYGT